MKHDSLCESEYAGSGITARNFHDTDILISIPLLRNVRAHEYVGQFARIQISLALLCTGLFLSFSPSVRLTKFKNACTLTAYCVFRRLKPGKGKGKKFYALSTVWCSILIAVENCYYSLDGVFNSDKLRTFFTTVLRTFQLLSSLMAHCLGQNVALSITLLIFFLPRYAREYCEYLILISFLLFFS